MTEENQTQPPGRGRSKTVTRRRRRRSSRHMLASGFGIFVLLVLTALGGLIWRLGQGPIVLTQLLPALEGRFANLVSGYEIKIGSAELIWETAARRPRLQFEQVQLTRRENGRVTRFGKLQADISLSALAIGEVRLNKVVLQDLDIIIERAAGGELMFSLPGIEGSGGRLDFRDLVHSAREGPLSVISELEVRDLKISLREAASGQFWDAPAANAVLRNGDEGLQFSLRTEYLNTGGPLRADAQLASDGTLVLVLSGNRISAPNLPPFIVDLIPPTLRAGELNGALSLSLSPLGEVRDATADVAVFLPEPVTLEIAQGRFALRELTAVGTLDPVRGNFEITSMTMDGDGFAFSGKGSIDKPSAGGGQPARFSLIGASTITADAGLYPIPTAFERLEIDGDITPATGQINLERVVLSTGAVRIHASGVLTLGEAGLTARVTGRIERFGVADLKRLWPPAAAPGAYDWIKSNMIDGWIENSRFAFSSVPGAEGSRDSLALDFTFRDVSSYHIGRATPITGAAGQGRLTLKRFDMQIEAGRLGDITLSDGAFAIDDLTTDTQNATVTVNFSGKVGPVLSFIDEPPISALSTVDIDPARTTGAVTGSVTASLPLLADLALEDVDFVVKARTRGLTAKNIAEGYSITRGNARFTVDKDHLRGRGKARLNGVPVKFDWTEQFDLSKKNTTDLTVTARLDDAQRKTFGIDLAPYVSGPVSVKLVKSGKGMNITRAVVNADLTEAAFQVPDTGITLAKGVAKQLSFTALIDGAKTRLRGVTFTSPDLTLSGGEIVLKANKPQSIAVDRLVIGNLADIGVRYTDIGAEGATLQIKGRYLDLSRMLAPGAGKTEAGTGLSRLDDLPRISVRAALGQFKISPAMVIDDFQLSLTSHPNDQTVLQGEARFAGSEPLQATWKRLPDGGRVFVIQTKDAGAVLRALGFFERAVGGRLILEGSFRSRGPGQAPEIKGRAITRDMVIQGASSLSDILDEGAGASLASLSEEIKGKGVKIDIVDVPFDIGAKEITIGNAFARGDTVGFTFAGTINRREGRTNLGGTIIPAYGLNSALGDIPLLGRLLVGRAKEGVVGITYSVSGPISNPEVSVNPLSALAPGILRRIFDRHGGTGGKQTAKRGASPDYPGDEENNADP